MTNIVIRQAVEADLPVLFGLDQLAAQGDENRREFIRHAVAAQGCIVAAFDDKIAGYAALEYTFFGYGFISMVYVHSDYQRRKIGQALIRYLELACKTPKLFTSTNLSNLPMQALLSQQGYVLSGEIHNLDDDDPELVYFKAIGF